MKNWRILLLSIIIITNTGFAVPQVIDKIAAIVNNDIVLKSDINILMNLIKLNARQTGQQLIANTTLRHQLLEHLILDQIVLQIGQKMGVKVTDEQLDQVIANIFVQNNMNKDLMFRLMACYDISYDIYRNHIRNEIIISEVRNNEVYRRVTILPQEVDILAKQLDNKGNNGKDTEINLSHIIILLPENPTSDQVLKIEKQAHSIVYQMRKDRNPNKSVIMDSTNQQALKYVYMGWRSIQEQSPIFAQALSSAKKGDVIGPIRSKIGFHILKVNDLRSYNQNILVTEVHARHILIKSSPILTDYQVLIKLQQIAEDIKKSKVSFANAAKEFSQDTDSASQGGDLGWIIVADVYDPTLRGVLTKLNKGKISTPIHSSFGWHLIEILDIRKTDKTNIMRKDRIYRMLFNRKFSREADTWMQEQRTNAYVKFLGE